MASTQSKVRIQYSPSELSILSLLPDDGAKVSSEELTKHHYRSGKQPFHARKAVVSVMASLMDKVKKNREPFIIKKSKRQGPKPIEFWKEKR